jgi:hypothetical protein
MYFVLNLILEQLECSLLIKAILHLRGLKSENINTDNTHEHVYFVRKLWILNFH